MLVLLSTRDPDPILTPFIPIFFLLNWRDFHEHFQLEISSKCDIKAENSSTLCKFHKRTKGLRVRPMGSNTDLDSFVHSCCWSRHFFFYDRGRLGRVEIVTLGDPVGNPLGTLWVGVREKEGKRGGGGSWLAPFPPLFGSFNMALRGEHHSRARRKRLHSRLGNAAVGYRHAPRSACFSVSRLSAKKKQVVSKEKAVP